MEELYKNESHTIAWGMNQISSGKFVLPLIQRKFVWNDKQILSLFDSVLQGFPISAILINKISEEDENLYYDFLKNVKKDSFSSQTANVDKKSAYSVLDGQQRLTALSVCFDSQSHFKYSPSKNSKDQNDKSKDVYICLSDPYNSTEEDSEYLFRIKMLEGNGHSFYLEKKQEKQIRLWVRPYKIIEILRKGFNLDVGTTEINEIPLLDDVSGIIESGLQTALSDSLQKKSELEYASVLLQTNSKTIIETSLLLFSRYYCDQNVLNCVLLNDPQSNNITDVFIRLNTGGTKLSYSDLLVTKLSSFFETKNDMNGNEYMDAKKRINDTIILNIKDEVRPNDESILKTFLVLNASNSSFGAPSKSSKVTYSKDIGFNTIAKINGPQLEKIHENWDAYERCIVFTYNFLYEKLGFDRKTLKSYNAVIPIILYFWLLGVDDYTKLNDFVNENEYKIAQEIKWYLYMVLLKNIFGSGSGDTILASICEKLQESFDCNNKDDAFDVFCHKLKDPSYTYSSRFNMVDEDVDHLMNLPKKHKLMYPLLSLLYPREYHKYGNDVDIDHMHPLSKKDLISLGDDIDKIVNLKLIKSYGKSNSGSPGNRALQDRPLIEKALGWAKQDEHKNPKFTESDLLMGSDAIKKINDAYRDKKPENNPLNSDTENVNYFVKERKIYIRTKLMHMFVDFRVDEIPTNYDFL